MPAIKRCEPHVSLFMLSVDETEVNRVTQTVGHLASKLPALSVDGHEYRHNPSPTTPAAQVRL